METVADMAGVRAKETDKVSIEFTKEEIALLLVGIDCWEGELFMWGSDKDFSSLKDKLKNANPDWVF